MAKFKNGKFPSQIYKTIFIQNLQQKIKFPGTKFEIETNAIRILFNTLIILRVTTRATVEIIQNLNFNS